MGVPPLSGFFSKEEILAVASHGSTPLFWIALTTVLLTAFYMARLVTIVFFPAKREHSEHHSHGIHEGDWRIVTPLLILAVLSVIGGFFPIKDLVTGPHAHGHDAHHGALGLALLSLGFAAFGALSGFFLYANRTTDFLKTLPGVKTAAGVFERKFYFDDLYDLMIQYVQEKIARVMDIIERYVIVEWSVNGLARFTRSTGNLLRGLQTGMVQFYAFFFVAGISLMLYFYLIADKVR